MKRTLLFFILFVSFIAVSFGEDSPAVEAAKRERERRAKLKAGRTFTNKDIQEFLAKHPSPPGAKAPGDSDQTQTQPQTSEATIEVADESTETYWRNKFEDVSARLTAAKDKITAIQSDIDTFTRAFYGTPDLGLRDEINGEREKRLEDLEVAKDELQQAEQALEDLEDEAHKAGVPPGWVR